MTSSRIIIRWLITLVISCSSFSLVFAQSAPDHATQIDALMSQLVEKKQFSGTLLIAKGDTVLLNKGYGMADVEKAIPNTSDTKFRIGILTEQFTAMAILMLQEQGKLNIDDSLCKYIDDCPTSWKPIKLRNLLIQTSGLPDRSDFDDVDTWSGLPTTPLEIVERVKTKSAGTVGSGSYSSFNYSILGYVIQQVSDQSYAEYLQDRIFTPLGMKNTGVYAQDTNVPNIAQAYPDPANPASPINPSTQFAQGDLYSTVGDLLLWNQALYSGKVIKQTTFDSIIAKETQAGASNMGMGSGYGLSTMSLPDHLMYFYDGHISGFSPWLFYVPDAQLTIVALGNYEQTDSYAFEQTSVTMLILLLGLKGP